MGRNHVNNIIDLDTGGRVYSIIAASKSPEHCVSPPPDLLPILLFLDFAAAFPSLAHAWLFLVLRAINIPLGALRVIECMYKFAYAVVRLPSGCTVVVHPILCGVIQGCPLAGTCFALAMDPLIRLMKFHICKPGLGIIRVCADDVGMALKAITSLDIVHKVFEIISRISGLKLKIRKTAIVPCCKFTPELSEYVQALLASRFVAWIGALVAGAARYLGAFLGPLGSSQTWDKPFVKYEDRAKKP